MVPWKYILKLCIVVVAIVVLIHLSVSYTVLLYEKHTTLPPPTHKVYTVSIGRLGNHLHNLVGVYGLSRTNNRKLVLQPNFFHYVTRFLNATYLEKFEIAVAPKSVPLHWFRYATYEPEMEHLPQQDLILGNNVQSIQYFRPYLDEINKFLIIKDALVTSTQDFLKLLDLPGTPTYVGIHVRRGDMLDDVEVNNGRLVPGPNYLQKAMLYFVNKYNNVHFIVCTDDVNWCTHNETYLQPGKLDTAAAYEVHYSAGVSAEWDLALLAQCNHTILTVGTFGWWGAWFAGGEAIYFTYPYIRGSEVDKDFTAEDYFWPTWIGMGDE